MGSIVLRDLATHDLPAIVGVHLAAFPESSLSRLGTEVVRRYYEWQLVGPHDSVARGSFLEDKLVGFCFAGVFRGAMSGFLARNRSFLIRLMLKRPWLVANPIVRERLVSALRIIRNRKIYAADAQRQSQFPTKAFGILAIAVHPYYQGIGVGKRLMNDVEFIAKQRGFEEMRLTVHIDNEQAVQFYLRLGWEKTLNDGLWSGKMRRPLAV